MENTVKNTVVHVGYPKAGSSFLQAQVFPFVRSYRYEDYRAAKNFSNYVVNAGVFFKVEAALKFISPDRRNYLLSNELLIGNPIKGIGINSETVPRRLKECGFEKVIISLRKDREKWIRSLYSEFLKLGGKLSFDDFLKNPTRHNDEYTWFYPDQINYAEEYIDYYRKVFGADSVLALYIDDYRNDKEGFRRILQGFLGTTIDFQDREPVNESLPKALQFWVRFFNNFSSSRMAPSSMLRWFSTARVIRFFQLFTKRSLTKYK